MVFIGWRSLTSVTFNANSQMSQIQSGTFSKSDMIAIEIPSSVEVICKSASWSCESLTFVHFAAGDSSDQHFESISDPLFFG
jgi:hypothetical protein